MASPLVVSSTRTYPVSVEQAFGFVLPAPLEQIFSHWYGPLPAIKGTEQDGAWGTVGQVRTIRMADGGTMREELTRVEAPHVFGYRIGDVTGPMKLLASSVDGLWTFDAAGTGSRITWQWTVHPASDLAGLAMPLFGRLWNGYARQSLDRIERLLLPE